MTMLRLLLATFLVLTTTNVSQGVFDGEQAEVGEYPYVVSISIDEVHQCGGFIYNERWIVTTAACVNGIRPPSLTMTSGKVSLNIPDGGQRHGALTIEEHPNYDPDTKTNDIALIQTLQSIPFDNETGFTNIQAANLLNQAEFMGWGATTDNGPPSLRLRQGNLTFVTQGNSRDCRQTYGMFYDESIMICAGDANVDKSSPCQYDEGSPLVQDNKAIGLVSNTKGCGGTGFDGIYHASIFTRLSSYESWINSIAGLPGNKIF